MTSPPGLDRRRRLLVLLPVAVLAIAVLWWPEGGDQALFIQYANQLRHGAVYYRDFWDIKQPGLYWFYELGDLLHPGGIGARILEGLLAVVAGAEVLAITAGWPLRRGVRMAAPTMVLGPYLIYSYLDGVGQIEGLLNVLLLTVLAATLPTGARLRPGWSWFVAGLAVGAVPVLKTLYTPIPLVLIVPAVLLSLRSDVRATLTRCGLAAAGAVIPATLALAYFVAHHELALALRTTFVLSGQVTSFPTHATDLVSLLRAALRMFSLLGPLAVAGLLTARRRDQHLLYRWLAVTVVTAFVLTLPQVTAPYRLLMFATPVGLLAVGGLDAVLSSVESRDRRVAAGFPLPWIAGLVALLLAAPLLVLPLKLLAAPSGQRWGLGEPARIARGENLPPEDTRPVAAAALVAGRIPPGSQIYVLGDPRIYTLTRTEQGAQIGGWTSELPPAAWSELARELARTRPRFVYIDGRDWGPDRRGDGRGVFDLVDQHYYVIATATEGTWYETDDVGTPLPEPGGNQLR